MERRKKDLELLKKIDGKGGFEVVERLNKIAPDFGDILVDFPFGEIYSRPGLDLKSRELATIVALTAMGNAIPQLKIHIRGALNTGSSKEEIIEVIIQMAIYAGFQLLSMGYLRPGKFLNPE